MQTQIRDLAARFARGLPEFSLTLSSEGAGNAGRRCAAAKSVHVVATVTPESPGIPRAMVLRFPSCSPAIGLFCHRRLRDLPQAWHQRRGVRTTRLDRPL